MTWPFQTSVSSLTSWGFETISAKVEPDGTFLGDPNTLILFSADFHTKYLQETSKVLVGDFRGTAFKWGFQKALNMQEYANKKNMIIAIVSPSSPETVSSGYRGSVR